MKLVFDIETDNLLDKMTKLHCIVAKDIESQEVHVFGPGEHAEGLKLLQEASLLIAHNGQGFDIPALQQLYPDFRAPELFDTLIVSRLLYSDLRDRDFRFAKKNEDFPKNLTGSHSLKAWGWRLSNRKTDYEGGFETFTQEMLDYCIQDVEVTETLYERLLSKEPSEMSVDLEHSVSAIIRRQESHGFHFDVAAAGRLYSQLCSRRDELRSELSSTISGWIVRTPFTPQRDNRTLGYQKGVTVYKDTEVEFNPESRDHIARVLQGKGWEPEVFTPGGKPKIDETVLAGLEYPEAKLLEEHFTVCKRLSQLSEGTQAWLKKEVNGRIHGRVNTNGAVTGRMTHTSPNIAQVPASYAQYGSECRSLFTASPGMVLVGCDADSLEGRCLAGYLAAFDGGEFTNILLKGNKDDGTDLHSRNASVLGCDRDTAKTFFYAFLYGAGPAKLGSILSGGARQGAIKRKEFLASLPALGRLNSAIQGRLGSRGYLTGLDGRHLHCRSEHSALNTLLQSAGAILMKRALVILDEDLKCDYEPGEDYEFVANVHDEWQIETKPEIAEDVGQSAVQAIVKAGEYFDFGCPLDGNYSVGRTWAETH